MNTTYTPETDESIASVAEKLTGFPQYAASILEYNNLPGETQTIPAGQTIVIPQSWSITTDPLPITITGAAAPDMKKMLLIGFALLAGLILLTAQEPLDSDD